MLPDPRDRRSMSPPNTLIKDAGRSILGSSGDTEEPAGKPLLSRSEDCVITLACGCMVEFRGVARHRSLRLRPCCKDHDTKDNRTIAVGEARKVHEKVVEKESIR